MRQRIIMKVQMNCEKCRRKARTVASGADGVASIAIGGPDRNELVVTGDGVDIAELVTSLKRKVGHTKLISVAEETEQADTGGDEEETPTPINPWASFYVQYPPYPPCEIIYCQPCPSSSSYCSIM